MQKAVLEGETGFNASKGRCFKPDITQSDESDESDESDDEEEEDDE